jgi:hypothetical protein
MFIRIKSGLRWLLRHRIAAILIVVSFFYTCIDPYTPNLKGYQSLLVVDGLITDADAAYSIKLSRTFQDLITGPEIVNNATVFLKDDIGNITNLSNHGNGIYITDSTAFIGVIGRTYTLHILTGDNGEYESDPCTMLPVPGIDSLYFERDQKLVNNSTETEDGLSIFLNSTGDNNSYYRWTYDETWKFRVPAPKKFDYVKNPVNLNLPFFIPVPDVKEFCWKYGQSNELIIKSVAEDRNGNVAKLPVSFIATEKSDRLLLQYSVLVKQYSLSKNEYDFWNNLKQVNEAGSDIFARQPYTILSNIHNIKNPDERVLGFFQVSALSIKRLNISYKEVALMGLQFYTYPCTTVEFEPLDFETRCTTCPRKTWDDVYWYLCIASDYTFIEPRYNNVSDVLLKMVFTRPECADCSLTGSHVKPDYWDEAFP